MQFAAILLQSSPDPEAVNKVIALMPMFMGLFLVVTVICLAIIIVPFWFICKKAGFSPWLSLLNIVPFGNLILVYVLAFAEWKVIPMPMPVWQGQPPFPPQPPYPPQA